MAFAEINYLSTYARAQKMPFKLPHMHGKSFVQNQYILVKLKTLHGKLTHMKHLKYLC